MFSLIWGWLGVEQRTTAKRNRWWIDNNDNQNHEYHDQDYEYIQQNNNSNGDDDLLRYIGFRHL